MYSDALAAYYLRNKILILVAWLLTPNADLMRRYDARGETQKQETCVTIWPRGYELVEYVISSNNPIMLARSPLAHGIPSTTSMYVPAPIVGLRRSTCRITRCIAIE